MRHTRGTTPEYKGAYLHFHNLIEIRAYRETESQRKEIYTYLSMEQARRIQNALNFMDKTGCKHVGHASWHVDNNKPEPCDYCFSE